MKERKVWVLISMGSPELPEGWREITTKETNARLLQHAHIADVKELKPVEEEEIEEVVEVVEKEVKTKK